MPHPVHVLHTHSVTAGSEEDTRNTADIVLLILSGARGGNCGIAYTNGYQHGTNFGWIAKNCHQAVTPHEVGHMFGCAHNKGWTSIQTMLIVFLIILLITKTSLPLQLFSQSMEGPRPGLAIHCVWIALILSAMGGCMQIKNTRIHQPQPPNSQV